MVLKGKRSPRELKMAAHEQPVKKKQRMNDHILPVDGLISVADIDKDNITPADETDCSIRKDNLVFEISSTEMYLFQLNLTKHCLCCVTENTLRKPFEGHLKADTNGIRVSATLNEWPSQKLLQFLSNVQLLFDVYLTQNTKGTICSRIMDVCDAIVRNEHNLIDEVINLGEVDNKYTLFLASRVLSSFLIVAKDHIDISWLKKIVDNLFNFERLDFLAIRKMIFCLEIIKRVVEWKDTEQHPLDDTECVGARDEPSTSTETSTPFDSCMQIDYNHVNNQEMSENIFCEGRVDSVGSITSGVFVNSGGAGNSVDSVNYGVSNNYVSSVNYGVTVNSGAAVDSIDSANCGDCHTVQLTDSESFDTMNIKCLTIKTLENKWPALVRNINLILVQQLNIKHSENCVLTFLSLWESIISVKANLSVIETRPFHAHLESFVPLLTPLLPSVVYKQLLSLFNEVLCYGSTLALQDMLPEEACSLAHLIVRHVKDFRLLDSLPQKPVENSVSFIGYQRAPLVYQWDSFSNEAEVTQVALQQVDKTLLQKMVLLVLKSVAITVKETRCDTSDSSIDSSDLDVYQDMQLIERSIRDVLKKLETFIKNTLEFHPNSSFSKILVHLFSNQDDYLIESMVCTLDITVGIFYRNSVFPDLAVMLNPTATFIEFLNIVSHDSDVLLDYLVDNETCFLLYLLRFLKYIRRNWSQFVACCHEHNCLDETMSVLIRLRLQISRLVAKSLFPYNIGPVLKLLDACEGLYEGNVSS